MEEKFSIARLKALLIRFWAEQQQSLKLPLILLTLLFGIITYGLSVRPINQSSLAGPEILMLSIMAKWLFLIFMIYHLHIAFAKGSGSVKSPAFFQLPATNLEKYIQLMLTGFIIPFLVYGLIFTIFNGISVLFSGAEFYSFFQFIFAELTFVQMQENSEILSTVIGLGLFLYYYFIFHLLIWGLMTFKNYAIVKVLGILWVGSQLIGFALMLFSTSGAMSFMGQLEQYSETHPTEFVQLARIVFILAIALLTTNFYFNYQQFKKKTVKA